ncbi:UDP-Glycosyltransferase superfamily protein [Actinidia rufa]|uniref:UDP-Glycosyltransferase superfamily protein n=1 Tax=Actinidia rufa TaxID=165716 RepID=A0A7J0GRI7_9ERIC|nr:UDP-Glycosyltransferase superfamily protein [Actinidia rufa]
MAVMHEEIEVMQHHQTPVRHCPKRSYWNIPPIPEADHPRQEIVMNDDGVGGSSRSSSRSNGSSSLVITASTKPWKLAALPISDEITLGTVANRMFAGLGSEPMKSSHSSVTANVMARCEYLAEVHHRVDVAPPGIGHGHHVASDGWFHVYRLHFSESIMKYWNGIDVKKKIQDVEETEQSRGF